MPCDDCSRAEGCPPCVIEPLVPVGDHECTNCEGVDPGSCPFNLPPPEGPEYTPCTSCGHIEPMHSPNEGHCIADPRCGCSEYLPAGSDHVCERYFCPTSGETESACHGGFGVCCSKPELHEPIQMCDCGHPLFEHNVYGCEDGCTCEELPPRPAPTPQPERRPPYAVAYSVGGHLYETFVPGDATVVAVDGGLVIKHAEPVIAIVQVQPVRTEK